MKSVFIAYAKGTRGDSQASTLSYQSMFDKIKSLTPPIGIYSFVRAISLSFSLSFSFRHTVQYAFTYSAFSRNRADIRANIFYTNETQHTQTTDILHEHPGQQETAVFSSLTVQQQE